MYLKSGQSGRNSPKGYANYGWKEQQSLKAVKKIGKKIHKVETGEDFGMAIRGACLFVNFRGSFRARQLEGNQAAVSEAERKLFLRSRFPTPPAH
jgi:hypothetical protein